jgi:hypothetical protein
VRRRHCSEGLRLCKDFERLLKVWGFAVADKQAAKMLPLGSVRLEEISLTEQNDESATNIARHAYVQHMTGCLVCSRHLVAPSTSKRNNRTLGRTGIRSRG